MTQTLFFATKMNRLIHALFLAGILLLNCTPLNRLGDRIPPLVTLAGPGEGAVYNGELIISFTITEKETNVREWILSLDGAALLKGSEEALQETYTLKTVDFAEGPHTLRLSASDWGFKKNRASRTLHFTIDRTPPEILFVSPTSTFLQGEVLPLFLKIPNDPRVTLSGTLFKQNLHFAPVPMRPGLYRALVAATAIEKTGEYELNVRAVDLSGNIREDQFPVTLKKKNFQSETIEIPDSRAGLLTDREAIRINREKLDAAISFSRLEQLWKGAFQRPVEGRVSSDFGMRRIYNNGVMASYHKGLDLANITGTPVIAANSGVVVLAEELPLNGNTVVLDHGFYVFSMYCHMSVIHVSKGQEVLQGLTIGEIGTTGLSTGPHLHWEIKVNNISVDPSQWESGTL